MSLQIGRQPQKTLQFWAAVLDFISELLPPANGPKDGRG
jgi:hypothetical protein